MRGLTIGVDARLAFDEVRRGIAKTTIGLYRAMSIARPDWRFLMFYREGIHENPFADCPNIEARKIDIRGDRFQLWDRVRLPWANRRNGVDLFHSPSGVAPSHPLARIVATIHDLIPLDCRAEEANVQDWRNNVERAARNARLIITASEHAKQRIVHHFRVPAEKIRIVHWAPYSRADSIDPITNSVTPYALHFGMSDPRKNTARVIDAWCRLPIALRERYQLKIVGVDPKGLDGFRRQIDSAGGAKSIELSGYREELEIRGLLAGAQFLAYPTLYEGFGMPILDAFAAGVPVLTAPTTSLPEVAGDAALYIDPNNTLSMTEGMAKLLADSELRYDLAQRGRTRVARFTWAATAETVAAIFEEVVAG